MAEYTVTEALSVLAWSAAIAFMLCLAASVFVHMYAIGHRKPGVALLESTWPQTLILHPDRFVLAGQRARRLYIALLISAGICFVAGCIFLAIIEVSRHSA